MTPLRGRWRRKTGARDTETKHLKRRKLLVVLETLNGLTEVNGPVQALLTATN